MNIDNHKFNMYINTAFSIFVIITLSSCAVRNNITASSKYYPAQNESRNELIKVYGDIPNELDIVFKAVWVAQNKSSECRYDTKYNIMFKTITKGFFVSMPVTISKTNNKYKAKFYIDKYIQGYCNWKFSHLDYIASLENKNSKRDTVIFKTNSDEDRLKTILMWCEPTKDLDNLRCGNKRVSPDGTKRIPLADIYESITPGYKKSVARVDVWCSNKTEPSGKNVLYCSHWNEKLRGKRNQYIRYGLEPNIDEVRVDFHYN